LGNTNALKHGFYSRRFRKSEIADLEATNFTGLRDEIAMLCVLCICIRRIVEWGSTIQSFPEAMIFMRVIALATGSLSRLVRTQQAIGGSDLESVLLQAISEVSQEMGITGPANQADDSVHRWASLIKSELPPNDE
jgi:hypothetical protein